MGEEALSRAGLYLDELHKLRVLKPEAGTASGELRSESREFLVKINQFQSLIHSHLALISALCQQVQAAKIKAIGTRNQLKSVSKERDAEDQRIQGLIREKQIELERIRLEHEALQKQEADLKDSLQSFISPM